MPVDNLPIILQNATAFNASDLNGTVLNTGGHPTVVLWFTPAGSYDGTVNYEYSPDGGTTFFAISAADVAAPGTLATNFATPTTTASRFAVVPAGSVFRARMSGGTQGSLTVRARLTHRLS